MDNGRKWTGILLSNGTFSPAPVLNPPIVHLASPDEAGWLSHGVVDDVALCDGEISTRSASSP